MQVAGRRSEFDASGDTMLCMSQLNLLAWTYYHTRSVKLARTIMNLAGSEDIQSAYLAEALQYCPKLMMMAGPH